MGYNATGLVNAVYDSEGVAVPVGWYVDHVRDAECDGCAGCDGRVERSWVHRTAVAAESHVVPADGWVSLRLPAAYWVSVTLTRVSTGAAFAIVYEEPEEGWPWAAGVVYRDSVGDRWRFSGAVAGESVSVAYVGHDGRAIAQEATPYMTTAAELGGQNWGVVAQAWDWWNRCRELLMFLAMGQPGAESDYNGVNHVNFSASFQVLVTGNDGEWITVSTAFNRPRALLSSTGVEINVQPGDMVRVGGAEALVVAVDAADGSRIRLHKEIPIEGAVYGRLYREMDRPSYRYPSPDRARWVHGRETGWMLGNSPVALLREDGAHGRIAYPVAESADWRGTFRVTARAVSGAEVDITAVVLSQFAGGGDWLWFDYVGGVWQTWIDLSGAGYGEYNVEYCVEVADQSNPGATSWLAYRPTQMMCKHCVRDFSGSIVTAHGALSAGYAVDAVDGTRWYCELAGARDDVTGELRVSEEIMGKFNSWCYLSKCPEFDLHGAWRPSSDDMAEMMVARDKYFKQQVYGASGATAYRIGRAGQPSLHYLAGMPCPTRDTGDAPAPLAIGWMGAGSWGCLRLKTAADGLDALTESTVYVIQTGGILEGGAGVFAQATLLAKQDRSGGYGLGATGQHESGDDYNAVEVMHGHRNMASIGMVDEVEEPNEATSGSSDGANEMAVQRVRQRPVRLPGLVVGEDVSIDNVDVTWGVNDVTLRVWALGRQSDGEKGRRFPEKNISAAASGVVSASIASGLLWLEFRPDIVETQWISAGNRESVKWLAGGGTVAPPPWLEIRNALAAVRHDYRGMQDRLCRGDAIRFTAGVTGLEDVRLTCVWAKAFGGSPFSGSVHDDEDDVDVPDSNVPAQWDNVPAWYQTAGQRLLMDRAAFDLTGYKVEDVRAVIEGWIAGAGVPEGVTVAVDTGATFPPVVTYYDEADSFTDWEISVRHRWGENYGESEVLSAAAFDWDAANGSVRLDVNGWGSGEHCVELLAKDGASAPWLYTRENSFPAEVISGLRAMQEALQWTEAGSFGTADVVLILHKFTDGDFGTQPPGSIAVSNRSAMLRVFYIDVGGAVERHLTHAETYGVFVRQKVFPAEVLGFEPPAPNEDGWNVYFDYFDTAPGDNLYGRSDPTGGRNFPFSGPSSGSAWHYSGPAGWPAGDEDVWLVKWAYGGAKYVSGLSVAGDGAWDDPVMHGAYQIRRFDFDWRGDALIGTEGTPPIRRWRPEWIKEAVVDINISGATQYRTHGTYEWDDGSGYVGLVSDPPGTDTSSDLVLSLGLFVGVEYDLGDDRGDLSGVTALRFEPWGVMTPRKYGAAVGSTVEAADQGKWVTIDITDLARVAADSSFGEAAIEAATVPAGGRVALSLGRSQYLGVTLRNDGTGAPYEIVDAEPSPWTDNNQVWFDSANDEYVFAAAEEGEAVTAEYDKDLYLAIVGAGDREDAAGALEGQTFNDLFYASCAVWEREYQDVPLGDIATGGGEPAGKIRDKIDVSRVEYDGVDFRNFRIRVDWDAVNASEDVPSIAYGSDFAAHWPLG